MLYSIALALTVVFALVSLLGGAVYLVWDMSPLAIGIAVAVVLVASFFILSLVFKKQPPPLVRPFGYDREAEEHVVGSRLWAIGLVPLFALASVCLLLAFRNQTDAAINTPWKQLPQLFWIALALASACGAAVLMRARIGVSFIATLLLAAVGTTVATIVFKIGYGYDPFVHQAAEQHILNFGMITPKTIYYSGQYALVVAISFLTRLPIHSVDVWLLPIFAPLGIASTLCAAATANKWRAGTLAAGLLMVLPLSSFINTTPYGLAALYVLLTAIAGTAAGHDHRFKILAWVFAGAALLTHPIAGVPALILAGCLQFKKPVIQILIAAGGIIILPALFAWLGKGFSFSVARIGSMSLPFELPLTRFHTLGDPLYLLGAAGAVIIMIGSVASRSHFLAAISAAASGILVAASIDFSYLPDSEQGGYAARLLVIALLIAAPAAAATLSKLFERAAKNGWRTIVAVAVISFFFTGGVYLAYPREDAYVISKGWNTSTTDLSAVTAIDNDANGAPYIVLAAQPVSAAALSKFGFFKYYDTAEGQIFAYPVPTGGPLYQFFLKMIYTEPSAEYMKQAMALAGVNRGYFVVNSYWTGADHVIGRAKQTSESWFGINNADYVFRYSR